MAVDEAKLHEFLGKAIGDFGGAASAALVVIGDKLGLYKAMADQGPMTPAELAKRTGTSERYVREWLANQAAGGYVAYDAGTGTFTLQEEQAMCLADENSPTFLPGGFQVLLASHKSLPHIIEAFRTGGGFPWTQHDAELFEGTERFFRPGYAANLISSWIPSLDGVEAKLRSGGRVADVGCGLGASTIIMAKAFPNSEFVGYDYHPRSVELARQRAKDAGVADRVKFDIATAAEYPGNGYDLVAFFDSLHDMGDPPGIARHVRQTLGGDGTWMIVEPAAGEKIEDNLNPIGRVYYAASTLVCVPNARSQKGDGLGAQAAESRLREAIVDEGGFRQFRRASETPFNRVFEAKP